MCIDVMLCLVVADGHWVVCCNITIECIVGYRSTVRTYRTRLEWNVRV